MWSKWNIIHWKTFGEFPGWERISPFCSFRPELVFDKNGIRVTSDPAADEHGVIELKVESGEYGQIVLIIENLSEEEITLKDITLLWSVNFFDYREISSIDQDEGELYPGNSWIILYNPNC